MNTSQKERVKLSPEKLKKARGDRRPTATARLLGITYQYLWQIENGKRNLDGELLLNMCKIYGITDVMALAE